MTSASGLLEFCQGKNSAYHFINVELLLEGYRGHRGVGVTSTELVPGGPNYLYPTPLKTYSTPLHPLLHLT